MRQQIRKWKVEHVEFARLLSILESQIGMFHEGIQPDYQLMLDIVYYLTHFPDRFHHPREDVAFVKLAERDHAARALVHRLLGEHQVIAASGKQLQQQLEGVMAGATLARQSVEITAATYYTYYRQHMSGEESRLFPRLQTVLRAEDWNSVRDAIAVGVDPLFGTKVKQRYRELRRQIEAASAGGNPISHK